MVDLYVELAAERMRAAIERSVASDALCGVLQASADLAVAAPGAPGCMTVLGIVNRLPASAALRDVLLEHRVQSLGRLRSRMERGVADGDLPAGTDVKRLSLFYAATLQAISLQAQDGATREQLQGSIDTAMVPLSAAGLAAGRDASAASA